MRIFRESDNEFRESPLCQAYGLKGGNLIVPIDVCIFEFKSSQRKFIPNVNSSTFQDVKLIQPGPLNVGQIKQYTPPSLLGNVNPVVKVQPSPGFNFPSEIRNLDGSVNPEDIPVDPNHF
jgi:hypothetical protein